MNIYCGPQTFVAVSEPHHLDLFAVIILLALRFAILILLSQSHRYSRAVMENNAVPNHGQDHIVDILYINKNGIEQTESRGTERSIDDTNNEYNLKTLSLLSLVKRLVETSTFHGLSRLTDSSVWIRIMWFLAITGAVAALSLQIKGLANDYLSFKVLTSIDIEQGNVAFPALTVCNNRRYLASQIVSLPLFENMSAEVSDLSTLVKLTMKFYENYEYLDPEDFLRLGANVSDTITVHTDQGVTEVKPLPYHGSCYTVETPKGTTLVRIVFNIHINDSIDTSKRQPGFRVYLKNGVNVYHHYRSVHIIEVKQGTISTNYITLEKENRLNGSYAKCQDNENEFYYVTGITYEKKACLYKCLFWDIFTKCNCLMFSYRYLPFWVQQRSVNNSSVPNCNPRTTCIHKAYKEHKKCDCKPRCHSKTFRNLRRQEIDLRHIDCKNEPWIICPILRRLTPANTSNAWLRSNFAATTIQLSNKPYKTYTQRPEYPLLHFLADIGGTMGFFLGASMLTYFELVQLVFSSLLYLLQRSK